MDWSRDDDMRPWEASSRMSTNPRVCALELELGSNDSCGDFLENTNASLIGMTFDVGDALA